MHSSNVLLHVSGAAVAAHVRFVAVTALDHLFSVLAEHLIVVLPGAAPPLYRGLGAVDSWLASHLACRVAGSLARGRVAKRRYRTGEASKGTSSWMVVVTICHLGHHTRGI